MFSQRQFIAGAIVLCSSGVLAAQIARHPPSPLHLTAKTECRAGCQGSRSGCQESQQAAVFNATDGNYLLLNSVTKIGHQKGNPGLSSDPLWLIEPYPAGSRTPSRIIVRPNLATCIGDDPHTQGITYYDFQVQQEAR